MIQTIVTAAILYIVANIRLISDFINVLARAKTRKNIEIFILVNM